MRNIADVVENMAEGTHNVIANLALHEEQEVALEKVMEDGIEATNEVFSSGLKLDSSLQLVITEMDELLADENSLLSAEKRMKLMKLLDAN